MRSKVLIKICGVQTPDLAVRAAKLGANFIGVVFDKNSKRYVTPAMAKRINQAVQKVDAKTVGVFVNHTATEMLDICKATGIEIVQLHGEISRKKAYKLPQRIRRIYVVNVAYDGTILDQTDKNNIEFLDKKRDFLLFDGVNAGSGKTFSLQNFDNKYDLPFFLAGGLNINNVIAAINLIDPNGVDVSSGIENSFGKKDEQLIEQFIEQVNKTKRQDRYGKYGGTYLPEILIAPMQELEQAFTTIALTEKFQTKLKHILQSYAGRPTPLTAAKRFSKAIDGPKIYLKREDLLHTGAHKINNALGQCLLAQEMGKTRIIAETGAGQHGVATATACAYLGLDCVIYMGSTDIKRQAPNVAKIELLGAKVISVNNGSKTLKDAINEALRDYAANSDLTHYCIGSALGPYPYPEMVRVFQTVIGEETKQQCFDAFADLPDAIIACVGGGSNAIGIFSPFIKHDKVQLIGVEAGGYGDKLGQHAARFQNGTPGVLHGCYSYLLQDNNGQVAATHSISAGLDYPSVGPAHADLFERKRALYTSVKDNDAVKALQLLSETEGIIPALESAHALAYLMNEVDRFEKNDNVVINLSGRGDKDLPQLFDKELMKSRTIK